MGHLDLELGDFVAFQDGEDLVLGDLFEGADPNIIFEITKKQIDIFSSPPGLEWELTFVRDDRASQEIPAFVWPFNNEAQPEGFVPGVVDDPVTDGGVTVTDGGETVYDNG
jgi:hypothetical protein